MISIVEAGGVRSSELAVKPLWSLRQCGLAVIGPHSSVLTLPPPAVQPGCLAGQCLTLQIFHCSSLGLPSPPTTPTTTSISTATHHHHWYYLLTAGYISADLDHGARPRYQVSSCNPTCGIISSNIVNFLLHGQNCKQFR